MLRGLPPNFLQPIDYIIFLCSITSITTDIAAAKKSAIGPAYISPSMPKNLGNRIINGIRQSSCLVIPRKVPFAGLPIDEKKLDESGCILFKNVLF